MKKTIDLLNAAVEMGFNREQALVDIDASLDGFQYRDGTASGAKHTRFRLFLQLPGWFIFFAGGTVGMI